MSIKRRRLRVDASEHKIGYGRPPRHSQYKPGQSGYPRGRPKGSRNFKTDRHGHVESDSENNL